MAELKKIAVIAGDGIGPEVVAEAEKVLKRTEEVFGYRFETEHALFGGIAIDEKGTPLPEETLTVCKNADAVLLGAVGGPKWDNNSKELRPETGLLGIRKALGLFSNLRPAVVFDCLKDASTLKPEVLEGTDLMVVRELTGGIYFGRSSDVKVHKAKRLWTLVRTTLLKLSASFVKHSRSLRAAAKAGFG